MATELLKIIVVMLLFIFKKKKKKTNPRDTRLFCLGFRVWGLGFYKYCGWISFLTLLPLWWFYKESSCCKEDFFAYTEMVFCMEIGSEFSFWLGKKRRKLGRWFWRLGYCGKFQSLFFSVSCRDQKQTRAPNVIVINVSSTLLLLMDVCVFTILFTR